MKKIKPTKEDFKAVESPELSDDFIKKMKPAREIFPNLPTRVRGPQKKPKKVQTTIRLSPEVITFFKTRKGRGWQTEVNKILEEHVKSAET